MTAPGRIVSGLFISLDGVVEAPERWHFPYYNDEMAGAIMRASGSAAFLMGRVLYDEWSKYWPGQDRVEPDAIVGDAHEFASMINAAPKYVVSTTLQDPAWSNTQVIDGDVVTGIRSLKATVDGDITMSGSATLVRWLLANGLLDELHLMIHPVVVGKGRRLFDGDTGMQPLSLVRHQVFETGVVSATYAPAER